MAPERMGEWTDATFLEAEPGGASSPGQLIHLKARSLGRSWPVTIAVGDIDPQERWIDMLVRMPFGIENHEHVTLTPTPKGGTLIRFN